MTDTIKKKIIVEVDAKDVSNVTKQIEKMGGAVNKTDKAVENFGRNSARTHRGLQGVGAATSNSTKAFAKMSQTMGGPLIQAYATVAAHTFAVTAAFGALREAANFTVLTKSAEVFGNQMGINLVGIATAMKEITSGAIDMKTSLKSASQAAAAGFDSSTIEQLTDVATKASRALGVNMTDAMNRVFKGAIKAEPELLDELGIILRLERAATKYARELGKTADELTVFEKQQAVANEVIDQGIEKFGVLGDLVAANPYDQLIASFSEISVAGLGLINTVLEPMIKFFATDSLALTGAVGLFAGSVIKKAIPALGSLSDSLSISAVKAANDAIAAMGKLDKQLNASRDAARTAGSALVKGLFPDTTKLSKKLASSLGKDLTPALAKEINRSLQGSFNRLGAGAMNVNIGGLILKDTKDLKKVQGAITALAASGERDFNIFRIKGNRAFKDIGAQATLLASKVKTSAIIIASGLKSITAQQLSLGAEVKSFGDFKAALALGSEAVAAFAAKAGKLGSVVTVLGNITNVAATMGGTFLKLLPGIGQALIAFQLFSSIARSMAESMGLVTDNAKLMAKVLDDTVSSVDSISASIATYTENQVDAEKTLDSYTKSAQVQINIMNEQQSTLTKLNAALKDFDPTTLDKLLTGASVGDASELILKVADSAEKLGISLTKEIKAIKDAGKNKKLLIEASRELRKTIIREKNAQGNYREVLLGVNTTLTKVRDGITKTQKAFRDTKSVSGIVFNLAESLRRLDTVGAATGEQMQIMGSTLIDLGLLSANAMAGVNKASAQAAASVQGTEESLEAMREVVKANTSESVEFVKHAALMGQSLIGIGRDARGAVNAVNFEEAFGVSLLFVKKLINAEKLLKIQKGEVDAADTKRMNVTRDQINLVEGINKRIDTSIAKATKFAKSLADLPTTLQGDIGPLGQLLAGDISTKVELDLGKSHAELSALNSELQLVSLQVDNYAAKLKEADDKASKQLVTEQLKKATEAQDKLNISISKGQTAIVKQGKAYISTLTSVLSLSDIAESSELSESVTKLISEFISTIEDSGVQDVLIKTFGEAFSGIGAGIKSADIGTLLLSVLKPQQDINQGLRDQITLTSNLGTSIESLKIANLQGLLSTEQDEEKLRVLNASIDSLSTTITLRVDLELADFEAGLIKMEKNAAKMEKFNQSSLAMSKLEVKAQTKLLKLSDKAVKKLGGEEAVRKRIVKALKEQEKAQDKLDFADALRETTGGFVALNEALADVAKTYSDGKSPVDEFKASMLSAAEVTGSDTLKGIVGITQAIQNFSTAQAAGASNTALANKAMDVGSAIIGTMASQAEEGSKKAEQLAFAQALLGIGNAISLPWPQNIAAFASTIAMASQAGLLGGGGGAGIAAEKEVDRKQEELDISGQSFSLEGMDQLVDLFKMDVEFGARIAIATENFNNSLEDLTALITKTAVSGGLLDPDNVELTLSENIRGGSIDPAGTFFEDIAKEISSTTRRQELIGQELFGNISFAGASFDTDLNLENLIKESTTRRLFGARRTTTGTDTQDVSLEGSELDIAFTNFTNSFLDLTTDLGTSIGLSAEDIQDRLQGFEFEFDVDIFELSGEELTEALTDEFDRLGSSIIETIIPSISEFQRAGEDLSDTFIRISQEFSLARQIFDLSDSAGFLDTNFSHAIEADLETLRGINQSIADIDEAAGIGRPIDAINIGEAEQQLLEEYKIKLVTALNEAIFNAPGASTEELMSARVARVQAFTRQLIGVDALAEKQLEALSISISSNLIGSIDSFLEATVGASDSMTVAARELLSGIGLEDIDTNAEIIELYKSLDDLGIFSSGATEASAALQGSIIGLGLDMEQLDNILALVEQALKSLFDFMLGIEQQIAAFGGNALTTALASIDKWYTNTIRSAKELGATVDQLNRINVLRNLKEAEALIEFQLTELDTLRSETQDYYTDRIDGLNQELELLDGFNDRVKDIQTLIDDLELSGSNPLSLLGRYDESTRKVEALRAQQLVAIANDDAESFTKVNDQLQEAIQAQLSIAAEAFQRASPEYVAAYSQALTDLEEAKALSEEFALKETAIEEEIKALQEEQNSILTSIDDAIELQTFYLKSLTESNISQTLQQTTDTTNALLSEVSGALLGIMEGMSGMEGFSLSQSLQTLGTTDFATASIDLDSAGDLFASQDLGFNVNDPNSIQSTFSQLGANNPDINIENISIDLSGVDTTDMTEEEIKRLITDAILDGVQSVQSDTTI